MSYPGMSLTPADYVSALSAYTSAALAASANSSTNTALSTEPAATPDHASPAPSHSSRSNTAASQPPRSSSSRQSTPQRTTESARSITESPLPRTSSGYSHSPKKPRLSNCKKGSSKAGKAESKHHWSPATDSSATFYKVLQAFAVFLTLAKQEGCSQQQL